MSNRLAVPGCAAARGSRPRLTVTGGNGNSDNVASITYVAHKGASIANVGFRNHPWYSDAMEPVVISAEAEILSRVIGPDNPSYTPDAARSILELQFVESDAERMNELAAKAREGSLTAEEEDQLHGYLFVGAMVDLLHSKARLSLKQCGS